MAANLSKPEIRLSGKQLLLALGFELSKLRRIAAGQPFESAAVVRSKAITLHETLDGISRLYKVGKVEVAGGLHKFPKSVEIESEVEFLVSVHLLAIQIQRLTKELWQVLPEPGSRAYWEELDHNLVQLDLEHLSKTAKSFEIDKPITEEMTDAVKRIAATYLKLVEKELSELLESHKQAKAIKQSVNFLLACKEWNFLFDLFELEIYELPEPVELVTFLLTTGSAKAVPRNFLEAVFDLLRADLTEREATNCGLAAILLSNVTLFEGQSVSRFAETYVVNANVAPKLAPTVDPMIFGIA